jgi:hypothetical protein
MNRLSRRALWLAPLALVIGGTVASAASARPAAATVSAATTSSEHLTVTPLALFANGSRCSGYNSTVHCQLTVKNTGTQAFQWDALDENTAHGDPYGVASFSPSTGTLRAGQSVPVLVTTTVCMTANDNSMFAWFFEATTTSGNYGQLAVDFQCP